METFYRVTYKGNGIYNELKKQVSKDTWLNLLSLKELTWLPKPPNYSLENKSYFTKKGFSLFQEKTLPIILKYLAKDKIKIETFSTLENIIYSDPYQVVTK